VNVIEEVRVVVEGEAGSVGVFEDGSVIEGESCGGGVD